MTNVQLIETRVHKSFDILCDNLSKGSSCEIGEFIIHNIRSCSSDKHSFDADVTNANGITYQAQVRLSLSLYENLLGNKVDISFIGPKINETHYEQTFSTL